MLAAREIGRRSAAGEVLLAGVSLELAAGERLAVRGPSGAGKTLLLRALALLDPLDEGEIRFRGEVVEALPVPEYRRRVIYLHQRPALFPGSVEENLRHPFAFRQHRGREFPRAWIVEQLERLGRGAGFLDKQPRDLSGGEGQLVALLRALALEPAVLLLDEPTAALDREAAEAVEELIARWLDAGGERALLWVTHDDAQTRRVTDRALLLEGGHHAR